MTTEQTEKEIKRTNEQFKELHLELIGEGLYELANKFSFIYYKSQNLNYKAGIDFVTELNKKY